MLTLEYSWEKRSVHSIADEIQAQCFTWPDRPSNAMMSVQYIRAVILTSYVVSLLKSGNICKHIMFCETTSTTETLIIFKYIFEWIKHLPNHHVCVTIQFNINITIPMH